VAGRLSGGQDPSDALVDSMETALETLISGSVTRTLPFASSATPTGEMNVTPWRDRRMVAVCRVDAQYGARALHTLWVGHHDLASWVDGHP